MSIRCKDLSTFSSLKTAKLIGGENGTNRIIRWVYYGDILEDMNDIVDWIDGSELIIMTDHMFSKGFDTFIEAMPKLNSANIAGIMINTKRDALFIPYEVVELANKLNLPLYILPWDIKLADVSKEICSAITLDDLNENRERDILGKLIFDEPGNLDEILNMTRKIDFKFGYQNAICIVKTTYENNDYSENAGFSEENSTFGYIDAVKDRMLTELSERNINVLASTIGSQIVMLINIAAKQRQSFEDILNQVYFELKRFYPKMSFCVGVGNSYENVMEIKKSYEEANYVLKVIEAEGNRSLLLFYDQIGIYAFLKCIKDETILSDYYNYMLKPLTTYDSNKKTELLNTLKVYFNNNFNMQATADELYIHKNTLKYRLEKIEEVLNCDIKDYRMILSLGFALKCGNICSHA